MHGGTPPGQGVAQIDGIGIFVKYPDHHYQDAGFAFVREHISGQFQPCYKQFLHFAGNTNKHHEASRTEPFEKLAHGMKYKPVNQNSGFWLDLFSKIVSTPVKSLV